MQSMPSHQCLVLKKPSPLATKPWRSVEKKLQKRWLVTRGNHVDYYTHPKPAKARPKGYFDLRSVTSLSASAPATITVGLGVISLVLDFGWASERHRWLRAWASGVRIAACALDGCGRWPTGLSTASGSALAPRRRFTTGVLSHPASTLTWSAVSASSDTRSVFQFLRFVQSGEASALLRLEWVGVERIVGRRADSA